MLKEVKTSDELDVLISKTKLCIVGFYSPKCLKCRELAPFFQQLSEAHPKVGFVRMNILLPSNAIALRTYNITSPTLVLFKDGKLFRKFEVERHSLERIVSAMEKFAETGSTRGS